MTTATDDSSIDPAEDTDIDRRTRAFLRDLNHDSTPFWELPGDQPQQVITSLQERTPVDLSGITISTQGITSGRRPITLHVIRPAGATGILPVFLFLHGAVWIAGNFENHQRLVRDLVVGSKAVAVFVEYTPVPAARCDGARGDTDPRPPLGAAYRRLKPVAPRTPVVPPSAPTALRLPLDPLSEESS